MMIDEKYFELSQFQETSQEMLILAKAGDWDKVPALEKKRKVLMLSIFENEPELIDTAQVTNVINEVLAINVKINELAEREKSTVSLDLKNHKQRNCVNSAYLQNI